MTTTKPATVVVTFDGSAPVGSDGVSRAAAHLYEAEVALHAARQSRVDAWVKAACDRLHEAVEAYRVATAGQAA
jgi:hypothetical protein